MQWTFFREKPPARQSSSTQRREGEPHLKRGANTEDTQTSTRHEIQRKVHQRSPVFSTRLDGSPMPKLLTPPSGVQRQRSPCRRFSRPKASKPLLPHGSMAQRPSGPKGLCSQTPSRPPRPPRCQRPSQAHGAQGCALRHGLLKTVHKSNIYSVCQCFLQKNIPRRCQASAGPEGLRRP